MPNGRTTRWRQAALLGLVIGPVLAAAAAVAAPDESAGVTASETYALNCLACHGADLEGLDGLGVSLVTSRFVRSRSIAELVAFLRVGRMPGDPASIANRPMPAFAWMAEEELAEVARYVKGRQGT